MSDPARVVAVAASPEHSFSKSTRAEIRLLAGLGVEGDAHSGVHVRHRSRVARTPHALNLRQVHLLPQELIEELAAKGFTVPPGAIGENILTRGLPLLELPTCTRLRIGASAIVEVTGLRNPCSQLDAFRTGLMSAVLDRGTEGRLIRKAGVMGTVLASGMVQAGDAIAVTLPDGPHRPLEPV